MKKIPLVAAFLILAVASNSQPSNLSGIAKSKLEGKWVGAMGKDSFTIVLLQTSSMMEKLQSVDSITYLYGWHQIKSNKQILETSLPSITDDLSRGYTIILSYKNAQSAYSIGVRDITRNRFLEGCLSLVDENECILKLWQKEIWRNDGKKYPEGQTFPGELKLKRVSSKTL